MAGRGAPCDTPRAAPKRPAESIRSDQAIHDRSRHLETYLNQIRKLDQQVADQMCVSPKTVDGYRKSLFEKLHVKSRVGLVIFAIKHNLVEI